MALVDYRRYCLNLQGYGHLGDEAQRQIDLARRFKPATCSALVLLALATQSGPLTLLLAALGYWAALFPNHPVDLLYRGLLQARLGAPALPPDPVPRRFACGMAATLLLIGAIGWQVEATIVGTIFVGMVFLALLTLAVADFCVGSFVYWLVVRRRVFGGT